MLVLVAYSELGIKSNTTRKRMLKILKDNICNVLGSCKFHNIRNRLIIETDADPYPLSRVFGIAYYAVCDHFKFQSLEHLGEYIASKYSDIDGKTYKVDVRREGNHSFTSIDAQKYLGGKVGNGRVNLKNPELTIHIEIRQDDVLIYDKIVRGPNGLPIGAEDRVLMLFSGGIDSPVAAWMMMKRGCPVDYLFINSGGQDHLDSVYRVYEELTSKWDSSRSSKFYVINSTELISKIISSVHPKYRQIVLKKAFYKLACDFTSKSPKYKGIVTGESIGQVSTQTLANLNSIQSGFNCLFVRPLIGLNKEEIIEISKSIGTYNLSTKVGELCNIAEGKVVTSSSPDRSQSEFQKIQPFSYPAIEYPSLSESPPVDYSNYTDKKDPSIPDDALFYSIEDLPEHLDPNKFYVIYCKSGVRARLKAQELRRKGFKVVGLSESEAESLKT